MEERQTGSYRLQYASDARAEAYESAYRLGFHPRRLRVLAFQALEFRALRALLAEVGQVDTILELPIGIGRVSPLIARSGRRLIGADISSAMLRVARKRSMRSPPTNGCALSPTLVLADASAIPLASNSVDLAVCHRLLHRLPDADRREILKDMGRVAGKGVIFSIAMTGGVLSVQHCIRSRIFNSKQYPCPVTADRLHWLLDEAGLRLMTARWVAPYLNPTLIVLAEPLKAAALDAANTKNVHQ